MKSHEIENVKLLVYSSTEQKHVTVYVMSRRLRHLVAASVTYHVTEDESVT